MLGRRTLLAGLAAASAPAIIRPAPAVTGSTVLFAQPSCKDGIAPHFSVTGAPPRYYPVGAFFLHANQPNPYAADGDFVPVSWSPAPLTGLQCPGSASQWQRGIWVPDGGPGGGTAYGHSVAQMYGSAVAAYLCSADLIHGSPYSRMMISPLYFFADPPVPFAAPASVLGVALELQVPTATTAADGGSLSNAYVRADLLFTCRRGGGRLSLSCQLFSNGREPSGDGWGFDQATNSVIIAPLVAPASRLVTPLPGSAVFTPDPWLGWRSFAFTMSQVQFALALSKAQQQARRYGVTLADDPADYSLAMIHLNAELHYTAELPTTLGWSMRHLTITAL